MPVTRYSALNFDPTLLYLGALQLTWHGVFTAVGTMVGIWVAVALAREAGYREDDTLSVALWGVVGAILGARLFHVIDQWDYYHAHPAQIVMLNEGGIAIYGAIVGGVLAGALCAWRRGLDVARLADVASLALILGMAIGRIGDIINGEHHGAPAEGFPLAVVYTNPNTLAERGRPVHLAVGYELVLDLAIFTILLWLARGIVRHATGGLGWAWRPRYQRDGTLFWIYLGLYSAGRFVVEFYRQDSIFALGMSQSQLLALAGAMLAGWMLVYHFARPGEGRMLRRARTR
jgi:phosphatidylglycerol:prolipoprotein diacylglycerol transferase